MNRRRRLVYELSREDKIYRVLYTLFLNILIKNLYRLTKKLVNLFVKGDQYINIQKAGQINFKYLIHKWVKMFRVVQL